MAGCAGHLDVDSVPSSGSNGDFFSISAVEIECQFRSSKLSCAHEPRSPKPHLFLNGKEECQRWMRQSTRKDFNGCREDHANSCSIVCAKSSGTIRRTNCATGKHRFCSEANRYGVHVSHEQPSRTDECTRKRDDDVARISRQWRASVCRIDLDRPCRTAGGQKHFYHGVGDLLFIPRDARNRKQLEHSLGCRSEIWFERNVGCGCL